MPEDGFYLRAHASRRAGVPSDNADEDAGGIDFRRIVKFLLNVVIKTGVLLLLHLLSWLKLAPAVQSWGFGGTVVTAVVLAVVISLLVMVGEAAFTLGFMLTCGLFLVLLPFAGWFLMKALLVVAPQFATAPNDHWFVLLLLGTALLLATVPTKRLRRQKVAPRGGSYHQTDGQQ